MIRTLQLTTEQHN